MSDTAREELALLEARLEVLDKMVPDVSEGNKPGLLAIYKETAEEYSRKSLIYLGLTHLGLAMNFVPEYLGLESDEPAVVLPIRTLRAIRRSLPWPAPRGMPAYAFSAWLGFKPTTYNKLENGEINPLSEELGVLQGALADAEMLAAREDIKALCQWTYDKQNLCVKARRGALLNEAIQAERRRQHSGVEAVWIVREDDNQAPDPDGNKLQFKKPFRR